MYKNKFGKIFESNFQRFQGGGVLAGDVVTLVDDILSSEWASEQANTVRDKLADYIDSNVNLRVTAVHSKRPAVQGAVQQDQQVDAFYCDVVKEIAPGLFTDPMTLPIGLLSVVDTGINLPDVPDSIRKDDTSHVDPQEVELESIDGEDELNPVDNTQSNQDSKKLPVSDTPGLGSAAEDNFNTSVYMN